MTQARPGIAELIAGARRVALVGLAKNTGKTQTLTSILAELAEEGARVGVTSIGRDGEEHDAIDARIEKPRIHLREGSLVASTDALLRASGVEHERLVRTRVRTPLGEVVVARLSEPGTVEVAGPSAAADVREVGDTMIALGAERVLIDGSIDRRAASAPAVADGLVMATGAVLGESVEEVVAATRDAVELVRLPVAALAAAFDPDPAADLHPDPADPDPADPDPDPADPDPDPADPDPAEGASPPVKVPRSVALSAEPELVAALLSEHPGASTFTVDGALSERLLKALVTARRGRGREGGRSEERELKVLARDPTKVFLSEHGPSWYKRQGVSIEVLETIDLRAITVNPVAPRSHRLDSHELREAIAEAVPGVPVIDVLDPAYLADAK